MELANQIEEASKAVVWAMSHYIQSLPALYDTLAELNRKAMCESTTSPE